MKINSLLYCIVAVLVTAVTSSAQTTLAKWTFESLTFTAPSPYTNGNARVCTNILPEIGSGTASGFHSGFGTSAPWGTSAGNGSSKSLTGIGWTNNPGDYYQFAVSTLNYQNIGVSCDQISSGTGPGRFFLAYSTDGINFTQFGNIYNVTSAPAWSATTANTVSTTTFDLSSVTAVTNQPLVYFRIVEANNTSASGATVGTAGTSRIDNFAVTGINPGVAGIVAQPQNLSVFRGDNAVISVTAGGTPPLVYQWYYTNSLGITALADGSSGYGAGFITNSASFNLTLSYIETNQAGGYFVVVTNGTGSITSSVANLTVGIRTPIATSIYSIRTNQTASWLPADTTNLYTATGTVTTPFNMTAATSREFYIEDTTGEGIAVFVGGGSTLPNLGDIVQVTGPIGQFDGLLEFNMSASNPTHSFTVLSSGNPLPASKYFDFASLTNISFVETNVEGSLVVVSNVFIQQPQVAGFVSGSSVNLTNLNGKLLNLFINAGAADVIASPAPPFASSIGGVFSQHSTAATPTNAYELDILQYASLVAGTASVTPIPLSFGYNGGNLSLTWTDASFTLQTATNVAGPYTDVTGATSPFSTNAAASGLPAQFFRLTHP